eukprot:1902489-Lingulodinium_polyedra.AAC.1
MRHLVPGTCPLGVPGHKEPTSACLDGAPGRPTPHLAPGACPEGAPGREDGATRLVPGTCPLG